MPIMRLKEFKRKKKGNRKEEKWQDKEDLIGEFIEEKEMLKKSINATGNTKLNPKKCSINC